MVWVIPPKVKIAPAPVPLTFSQKNEIKAQMLAAVEQYFPEWVSLPIAVANDETHPIDLFFVKPCIREIKISRCLDTSTPREFMLSRKFLISVCVFLMESPPAVLPMSIRQKMEILTPYVLTTISPEKLLHQIQKIEDDYS